MRSFRSVEIAPSHKNRITIDHPYSMANKLNIETKQPIRSSRQQIVEAQVTSPKTKNNIHTHHTFSFSERPFLAVQMTVTSMSNDNWPKWKGALHCCCILNINVSKNPWKNSWDVITTSCIVVIKKKKQMFCWWFSSAHYSLSLLPLSQYYGTIRMDVNTESTERNRKVKIAIMYHELEHQVATSNVWGWASSQEIRKEFRVCVDHFYDTMSILNFNVSLERKPDEIARGSVHLRARNEFLFASKVIGNV